MSDMIEREFRVTRGSSVKKVSNQIPPCVSQDHNVTLRELVVSFMCCVPSPIWQFKSGIKGTCPARLAMEL